MCSSGAEGRWAFDSSCSRWEWFLNISFGVGKFLTFLFGGGWIFEKTTSQKNFRIPKRNRKCIKTFWNATNYHGKTECFFGWCQKSSHHRIEKNRWKISSVSRKLLQWLRSKKDNDNLEDDFLINIIKSIVFFSKFQNDMCLHHYVQVKNQLSTKFFKITPTSKFCCFCSQCVWVMGERIWNSRRPRGVSWRTDRWSRVVLDICLITWCYMWCYLVVGFKYLYIYIHIFHLFTPKNLPKWSNLTWVGPITN